MKHIQILCMALALLLMPVLAMATPMQALTSEQSAEVEKIVRELLTKKEPQIVIDAAKAYQEDIDKKSLEKSKEMMKTNAKNIFHNPNSPVAGNPKGDVTVVEFFDYACGYCKHVQGDIARLINEDKNIRFVFKELPIFGPSSKEVSKLALASVNQDKYLEFHMALLKTKKRLTKKTVMTIAKSVGLDTAQLEKDANAPKIAAIIEDNTDLAKQLGVNGTPAFIIGETIYSGAISYKKMKAAIATIRAEKK